MKVSLTKPAIKQAKHYLKSRGKGLGVRFGVTTTGCSGLAYLIEFVDEVNDDDTIFTQNKLSIIVDNKSLMYLQGTEIDYVQDGLQAGFEFNNPNKAGECGCGESFTI